MNRPIHNKIRQLQPPASVRAVQARLYENEAGRQLLESGSLRSAAALFGTFIWNTVYAVFKLVTGVIYHSLWFSGLGVYYLVLAVMRFVLVRGVQHSVTGGGILAQYRRCRLCGYMMLILNAAFVGLIAQMVFSGRSYDYPGVLIYAMAAYTFYAVIASISDLTRNRRAYSPIIASSKVIRAVTVLVSMLALETAMLSRFGDPADRLFRMTITGLSGLAVSIAILTAAVLLVISTTRSIRRLKAGASDPI